MNYDLAVFDLDGTILDTLEDLHDSLNYALRQAGMPERTMDEVRRFVGNGIGLLIQRGVPDGTSVEAVEAVQNVFMPYYLEHCEDKTKPYPGIKKTLMIFRHVGIRLAVVSNKADTAVKELCDRYFPDLFDVAVGEREGIRRKPAPDTVNEVLRVLNVPRGRTVYIGDSEVDIQTARNAEIDCLSVLWGFRDEMYLREQGASTLIRTPHDLLAPIVGDLNES